MAIWNRARGRWSGGRHMQGRMSGNYDRNDYGFDMDRDREYWYWRNRR